MRQGFKLTDCPGIKLDLGEEPCLGSCEDDIRRERGKDFNLNGSENKMLPGRSEGLLLGKLLDLNACAENQQGLSRLSVRLQKPDERPALKASAGRERSRSPWCGDQRSLDSTGKTGGRSSEKINLTNLWPALGTVKH